MVGWFWVHLVQSVVLRKVALVVGLDVLSILVTFLLC
jgi:hypothetical protein